MLFFILCIPFSETAASMEQEPKAPEGYVAVSLEKAKGSSPSASHHAEHLPAPTNHLPEPTGEEIRPAVRAQRHFALS